MAVTRLSGTGFRAGVFRLLEQRTLLQCPEGDKGGDSDVAPFAWELRGSLRTFCQASRMRVGQGGIASDSARGAGCLSSVPCSGARTVPMQSAASSAARVRGAPWQPRWSILSTRP